MEQHKQVPKLFCLTFAAKEHRAFKTDVFTMLSSPMYIKGPVNVPVFSRKPGA